MEGRRLTSKCDAQRSSDSLPFFCNYAAGMSCESCIETFSGSKESSDVFPSETARM